MPTYHCTACENRFELNPDKRFRCPHCLRSNTIVLLSDDSSYGRSLRRKRRKILKILILVVIVAVLAGGGYLISIYLSNNNQQDDNVTQSVQPNKQEQKTLSLLMCGSDCPDGILKLAEKHGADDGAALSGWIEDQIAKGKLSLLSSGRNLNRPPFEFSDLLDNRALELSSGETMALYPAELTALLISLCSSGGGDPAIGIAESGDTSQSLPISVVVCRGVPAAGYLPPGYNLSQDSPTSPSFVLHQLNALTARYYMEAGDLSMALAKADTAVNAYPSSWSFRALRGDILLAMGNFQKAREDIELAVSGRKHPYTEFLFTSMQGQLTGAEEVITMWSELLENYPKEAYVAVELGQLYLMSGKNEEARTRYEQALQRDPQVMRANSGIAMTMSDPQKALPFARRETELHPLNSEGYVTLAFFMVMSGDNDKQIASVIARGRELSVDPESYDTFVEQHMVLARELIADKKSHIEKEPDLTKPEGADELQKEKKHE